VIDGAARRVLANNPKRALYNRIYHRTTVDSGKGVAKLLK